MSTTAASVTRVLPALRERLPRGVATNEQLTAVVATLLLVLLAIEGATLLDMRRYLSVHAFVGMLLIPVVALKLASTGWRMMRYYVGAEEYVRRGPPHVVLRMLVAPVVVTSTVALFATGVALLVLDQTRGPVVGLHQASFVVWFGAMSVHVLTRLPRLAATWQRLPGRGVGVALVACSLVAGCAVALATLPGADHLQDRITAQTRFDDG